MSRNGGPTVACPTCNGPLSGNAKEWVCEVGHRFSFPQLMHGQAEAVVRSLWYALRALEDRAISSKFVAASFEKDGLDGHADRLRLQGVEDLVMVDELHKLLRSLEGERPRMDPSETISHVEQPGEGSHN